MEVSITILVPRLDHSGPVRGAIALFNGLNVLDASVRIIPIYDSMIEYNVPTDDFLLREKSFYAKIVRLKKNFSYEKKNKVKKQVIISFCIQSDLIAFMSGLGGITISSVRGNLYQNYKDDFGVSGNIIAWLHYNILSRLNILTALNQTMKRELSTYSQNVVLIPNFIDEQNIDNSGKQPDGAFKFVFVGKLSKRKAILETLEAFALCVSQYPDIELHVIGIGPLMDEIIKIVKEKNLRSNVTIHGFLNNPLQIVKECDVFVLPSYSEGISRAGMEALFLGKRCIMQNVDSNIELIESDKQGKLIDNIVELPDAMIEMLLVGRIPDNIILPKKFRQDQCSSQYMNLIG